jgi:hypothetical protein
MAVPLSSFFYSIHMREFGASVIFCSAFRVACW